MQYIDLHGKQVSRVGLGVLRMPKKDNVIIPESAVKLIRYAIDHGINFIDTAYAYAGSETAIGIALQDGYREKVVLSTKTPLYEINTKEKLYDVLYEELDRLKTDYIDYYLIHGMNIKQLSKMKEIGAFDFLEDIKAKGIIKHIGFSIHDNFENFKTIVDSYDWELAMVQYNYYDENFQVGKEGVKYAHSKGIKVLTMESLHGGMLANNVPDVVKNAFGDFANGTSDAEKSFMWLYDQKEVDVILTGISQLEHLQETLKIFENAKTGILTDDDKNKYVRARDAWNTIVNINCTGCAYCVPCPQGINIPEIFHQYNLMAHDKEQKWIYKSLLSTSTNSYKSCVGCGLCMKKCPQELDIINELKNAHFALGGE